jgi:hypothetical protein
MRRFRFSIASLLGVVLFISVALAALRASTDVWDGCLLALDLAVLLTAILLAVHSTNPKRAYWLGSSSFGWMYLIASMIPSIGSRLPTTRGLAYLETKWIWPLSAGLAYFDHGNDGNLDLLVAGGSSPNPPLFGLDLFDAGAFSPNPSPLISTSGSPENFVRIGHSLLALGMALIGGRLSRRLYDKSHVQMASGGDHPSDDRRRP